MLKIKKEYTVREVLGEHLLIRQGQSTSDMTQMITLNGTALQLWNEFQGKDFSEDDVTAFLLDHYDVAPQVAAADAKRWLENLKKCHVIADA